MGKVVRLPDLPLGSEFEELSAAYFQTNGLFLERNVVDRQEEEVLELDFIATEYKGGEIPIRRLCEVKSGDWGFGEIFKIRGWMDYLDIQHGCLLVRREREPMEFYRRIADKIGISLICISDIEMPEESLRPILNSVEVDRRDVVSWRFAYWTDRCLQKLLKLKKKSHRNKKCYAALDEYFFLANSRSFFEANVIERAQQLYEAFKAKPHISARTSAEIAGLDFDGEFNEVQKSHYSEAYYDGKLTDLSISTFVEHRARLALLKAAIEYKVLLNSGVDHGKKTFHLGENSFQYDLIHDVPASFRNALSEISNESHFYKYPLIWQWFLHVFGGFILRDYESEEHALLAQRTGVPPEAIPCAFAAYEKLFPVPGGWFLNLARSNIRLLKFMSPALMGVGANHRRLIHTSKGEYSDLKVGGTYTMDDLRKWANVTIQLLSKKI